DHPVLRRRGWFVGAAVHGKGLEDIGWFTPEGDEMQEEHWGEGFAKSMALFLNGHAIRSPDAFGQRIVDDSFLLLFNAHFEEITFTLPVPKADIEWIKVLDTAAGGFTEEEEVIGSSQQIPVQGRSLMLLKWSDSRE
ncbi:MAG: hypothetical protein RBS57_04250, partial [Desulforhabdus sp.]|nr:hypothetical protein [Desulforhabdus sp.]